MCLYDCNSKHHLALQTGYGTAENSGTFFIQKVLLLFYGVAVVLISLKLHPASQSLYAVTFTSGKNLLLTLPGTIIRHYLKSNSWGGNQNYCCNTAHKKSNIVSIISKALSLRIINIIEISLCLQWFIGGTNHIFPRIGGVGGSCPPCAPRNFCLWPFTPGISVEHLSNTSTPWG